MSPLESAIFFWSIAVLIALIWFLSLISAAVSGDVANETAEAKKKRQTPYKLQQTTYNQGLVGIKNAIDAYSETHHSEDRKRAKRERITVIVLFATAVFAALAAIAAGASAWIFEGQLEEMRAEQRPWIYAETPIFLKAITRNIPGVWEMRIEFKLQNTGHLPAMNVTPIVQSPVVTFNKGDAIAEYQHESCIDRNDGAWKVTGDTIFPGQIIKHAITIGIWPKDMANAYAAINHYDPWIIGCFAYLTPSSKLPHFTRFAYVVSEEGETGGPTSWLPYDPSNIPPNKLHVEPFLFKDSFAAD